MTRVIYVVFLLVAIGILFSGCTAKQAMLNKKLASEIETKVAEDAELGPLLEEIRWERGALHFVCKRDSNVGITGAFMMSRRIVEEFMLPIHNEAESHPGTLRADVLAFEANAVDRASGTGDYRTLASATYNIKTDKWDRKRYGMSGE